MKRLILLLILAIACTTVQAQLYVPGETLNYKMSYRAKLFPNTEVANVVMQTTETTLDGQPVYKVFGLGQTAKGFSWISPCEMPTRYGLTPQRYAQSASTPTYRRATTHAKVPSFLTGKTKKYTPAGRQGNVPRSFAR